MSYVKDIKELHISIQSILLAIILIMPFWYFDMYLLKPDFLSNAPIQIPIIASFCFSVGWVLINFISVFVFVQVTVIISADKEEIANGSYTTALFAFMVLLSFIHIGIYSLIGYILKLDFKHFLLYSFSLTVIRIVFWSLTGVFKKNKSD